MDKPLAEHGLLTRVEALVGDDLREVERIFHEELDSRRPCVRDVLAHATRFRGKRLRPMLLLLSAAATGRIGRAHHVLAAVVEMIHTATLVHDDVLDEADTRRHVATVNARWNNETSVLFGDYLFTHAFHLASSLETTYACRRIGRSTNIVCEGELSQIHERGNCDLGEEAYLQIIDGKTAELCAVCCLLGAHYAGAGEDLTCDLERYGRSLGVAFQICDDLLDIVGSECRTGKSLGTDFKKQKMTLPLIRLLSQARADDDARIRELLARPTDQGWSELTERLAQSDAIEYTLQRARDFAASARQCLNGVADSPGRRLLEELTDFAAQRAY